MTRHFLVGSLALLLAACTSAQDGPSCSSGAPQRPCPNGAVLAVFLPLQREQLQGATVTVCLNDDCAEGTLSSTNLAGEPTPSCTFDRSSNASCDVPLWEPGYGYELDVGLAGGPTTLGDGDVYSLSVRTASGEAVLDLRENAHYVTFPGTTCTAGCTYARIDHTGPRLDASTTESGAPADGRAE
jgi:hypothetical protein